MFVSSANNFGTAVLNAFEMSFIYIRNRRGPRTEPCGTPRSTVFYDDVAPLTLNGVDALNAWCGRKAFRLNVII